MKKTDPLTLLVSMPFASCNIPSIGLGLLQASIERMGLDCHSRYFTFDFSELIGDELYSYVANGYPDMRLLLGEWIFSGTIEPQSQASEQEYFAHIRTMIPQNQILTFGERKIERDKLLERILHARNIAQTFVDRCAEEISLSGAQIVGFTSTFQQHTASLGVAKRLKAIKPEVSIVFGGANCEGAMGLETIKQFGFVDVVVSGEGDLAFPEIVRQLLGGEREFDIPGVFTRLNFEKKSGSESTTTIMDLDQLPYPEYRDYFEQRKLNLKSNYFDNIELPLETSRGCWWGHRNHCTFCGLNGTTLAYRSKSADRAIEEIAFLTGHYGITEISVVDNILDMKYFKTFLPKLIERKMELNLFYEVKANLTKEQIKTMRQAGIKAVQPGIESLSDQVLALMKKGLTGLQNIQFLKWSKELNMDTSWNMLHGFPKENPEEYQKVAELISSIEHLQAPEAYAEIRLDRFSPNFTDAEKHGFVNVRPTHAYRFIYSSMDEASRFNMAYYFDYDHAVPVDVSGYTKNMVREIIRWRDAKQANVCLFINDGPNIIVVDSRSVAKTALKVISGVDLAVFRSCDQVRGFEGIVKFVHENFDAQVERSAIEQALELLIQHRYVIENNHHFLTIVTSIEEMTLSDGDQTTIGQLMNPVRSVLEVTNAA